MVPHDARSLRGLFALTAALCIGVAPYAQAHYPFALGGEGFDAVNGVAVSAGGLVVIGAEFEGTIDVDPGPGTASRTSVGFDDALLAAYAEDGTFFWAHSFGSAGTDRVDEVAFDASGRPYAIGHFSGSVDFDPGPGTFVLTPAGSQAVFVAAYNVDGTFRWALALGAQDFNYGGDITVDGTNVFVTGGIEGSSDFDPGPGTFVVTANRGEDAFVASYTTDGAFRWAFNLGTAEPQGATFDEGTGIVARDGHVWVTGMFSTSADFQPGPGEIIISAGTGFNDMYLIRYSADGPPTGPTFEWGLAVGADSFDGGLDLAVDESLNSYVVGFFNGTTDFDPGGATTILSAVGGQDAFVASYGLLGGFRWAFGLGSGAFESADAITYSDGAIYVGGSFGDTVDFDAAPTTSMPVTATGFDDAFVARYTSTGGPGGVPVLGWVLNVGAPETGNGVEDLALSPFTGLLAVGHFEGAPDFDPGPDTAVLTSAGLRDGFIAEYTVDGTVPTTREVEPGERAVLALSAPAPTPVDSRARMVLTAQEAGPVRVTVVDLTGRTVATLYDAAMTARQAVVLEIDASALAPGVYLVHAIDGSSHVAVRRLIVTR